MNTKQEQGLSSAGYTRCALPSIQSALSTLFSELQDGGDRYSRAASTNVIIPVASRAALDRSEALVEELARLHPSRFFIVCADRAATKVEAEVTARCHLMGRGPDGKTQHVCSEVVRLLGPAGEVNAIAEVLRANLVIGTPTEVVFFESGVAENVIAGLLPLCEHLFLDSSMFVGERWFLESVRKSRLHAVDVQWIALGAWRDSIKAMFDQRASVGLARGLERIEISSDSCASVGQAPSMASVLLAGWCASRLGLELRSFSKQETEPKALSFDGISPAGSTVRIAITSASTAVGRPPDHFAAEDSPEPKVRSVSMQGIARGGRQTSVRIERTDRSLEALVRGDTTVALSRPLDEEGGLARLKRYFLIGESTLNYGSALGQALRMLEMCSGKLR